MAETPLSETLERSPLPAADAAEIGAAIAEEAVRRARVTRGFVLDPDRVMVASRPGGRHAVRFVGGGLPSLKPTIDPAAEEAAEREQARVLGALIYRMLTGVVLPTDAAAADRPGTPSLGSLQPPSARSGGQPVPVALDRLVMELLAPDAAQRPKLADASARLTAIARELGGVPAAPLGASASGKATASGKMSSARVATAPVSSAAPAAPTAATPARSSGKTIPLPLPPLPTARTQTGAPVPVSTPATGPVVTAVTAPVVTPVKPSPRVTQPLPAEEETSVDDSPRLGEPAPLPPPPVVGGAPPAPVVVEAAASERAKRPTDTQAERFFAEGERMAEKMRAEAVQAQAVSNDSGPAIIVDVEDTATLIAMAAPERERRRRMFLIAGGAGAVALIFLLWVVFGGSDKESHASGDAPDAAPDTWSGGAPVATAAPAPAPVPAAAPDASPPAAPPDASPPPVVAAKTAPAEEEEAPAPRPRQPKTTPPPPPAPTPAPAPAPRPVTPAPKPAPTRSAPAAPTLGAAPQPKGWGSEWLARARDFRARKKYGDAYNAYFQASSKGDKAVGAAGQLGMAEMAYAQKRYADAIAKARTALKRGASSRHAYRVIANASCALGDRSSANSAYAKSGGGSCR